MNTTWPLARVSFVGKLKGKCLECYSRTNAWKRDLGQGTRFARQDFARICTSRDNDCKKLETKISFRDTTRSGREGLCEVSSKIVVY